MENYSLLSSICIGKPVLTGLDLFFGERVSKECSTPLDQRIKCIIHAAFHALGVALSPFIILGSVVIGTLSFFAVALVMPGVIRDDKESLEDLHTLFETYLLLGLGVMSPVLHTAAAARCIAGAIISPNLYLSDKDLLPWIT